MTTDFEERIVDEVIEQMYSDYPSLFDRYGEKGKRKAVEDNYHHMKHLATAYELNNPQMFVDYVRWLQGILQGHGMTAALLRYNFEAIDLRLAVMTQNDRVKTYRNYLSLGIQALQ
ncbi:hypothetical protein A374_00545 [Fictibacillus macauensis ZFHKF-1]|uniref:Uncharacterized protein n=1 Tax=Fictibacillus macauensis ZFHKF-1 TaxID=1196324 RepID=I8AN27_9BACL|nr:hypothetical protein [Fictibacillus macauensis]EIT87417.1 hypothetical protein A374_00545 [Fictibacillus macauensis ZFHKF-1]